VILSGVGDTRVTSKKRSPVFQVKINRSDTVEVREVDD